MQQLTQQPPPQHSLSLIPYNQSLVRFIDQLIEQARTQHATDIHYEPHQQYYRIRLRIDGLLHTIAQPPINIAAQLTSRIKVMANLDISERRLPQDGRWQQGKIDIRVSTCPTLHGEKIVMRLLNSQHHALKIDGLGFTTGQQALFLTTIKQPQGLVILTGPTGCGKTSSLYSALQYLNQCDKNIITIEDPVEIMLDGINQVNVNRKAQLDFAKALRAFLRQDPDIIMVGEIRDNETATIAIHAAQTGHLVLSTLHSNSSQEAITRLVNMGIPPYQLLHSVTLITAQRLMRKLCPYCKTRETLDAAIRETLTLEENSTLYRAVGCCHCLNGYRGRIAIHELLPINALLCHHYHDQKIIHQLMRTPIIPLKQRALSIAKAGETSLKEIHRTLCQ